MGRTQFGKHGTLDAMRTKGEIQIIHELLVKTRENRGAFAGNGRVGGLGGRAAGSGLRRVGLFARLLDAACLLDRAAQEELDLPVEAPQIVVRPALDGFQQGRVDTKEKRFPFSQGCY